MPSAIQSNLARWYKIINKATNSDNQYKICVLIYSILRTNYKENLNKTRNIRMSVNEPMTIYDWERKKVSLSYY
jgi:hypothetical protein